MYDYGVVSVFFLGLYARVFRERFAHLLHSYADGVPEMQQPQAVVEETVRNVLAIGRAKDIAHVFYWETFNNVLATGGNCVPGSPPVTDPTLQV
jgi:hypothetical protein